MEEIEHVLGDRPEGCKKIYPDNFQMMKNILNVKVSDLADEYNRLSNRFERAKIEHKLAVEYFDVRNLWFHFLPVTIIAALITVIGFLITGTQNDDGELAQNSVDSEPLLTGRSSQLLSLAVGILGVISSLFNTIGKRNNYQSKCDMHRSAVKALEKICLTVEFEKDWFSRKTRDVDEIAIKIVMNPENRSEHEDVITNFGADLKSYQASFKAMQDACCESPVPTRVIQAFAVLDQLNELETDHLVFYYVKLWKEFSTYRRWPMKAPRVDVRVKMDEWEAESTQTQTPVLNSRKSWLCCRQKAGDVSQV